MKGRSITQIDQVEVSVLYFGLLESEGSESASCTLDYKVMRAMGGPKICGPMSARQLQTRFANRYHDVVQPSLKVLIDLVGMRKYDPVVSVVILDSNVVIFERFAGK